MGTQIFCNESLAGDDTIKESLMYSGFYLKNFMDLFQNFERVQTQLLHKQSNTLSWKNLIQIYVITK